MKKISLVLVFVVILTLFNSTVAADDEFLNNGTYDDIKCIDLVNADVIDENNDCIPFEDVTISLPIPKKSGFLSTLDGGYETHVFVLHGGLKKYSNGTFTWYFNLDCETAILNKPHVIVELQLYACYTDSFGEYTQVDSVSQEFDSDFDYPVDYTFTTPSKTAYYRYGYTIKHIYNTTSERHITPSVLYNRTGHKWEFLFTDVGKTLPMPRADYVKGQTHERNDHLHISYYNMYYVRTGIKLDRSLYEVHHIQPLSYGGDNSYENLIHLPIDLHKKVTGWFNGY